MTHDEVVQACLKHTVYSWCASGGIEPITIARAKGIHMWDLRGKRYIDFNSQVMSVLIGHSHPHVIAAMKRQLDTLIFAYPGSATEVRARLSTRLAELMPGDLDAFFFTLGGAEANENAIRAARLYTGRSKILARYRSYHGATNAAMQLSGDPRRWANEPGMPGVVHVMDPWPYRYSFGESEEEITRNNLRYLDEVIQYEGPQTIAAMIIETVTGTNGVLPPPAGYLEGLRELLDRHGILLICDEVMAGFGRTGRMFAFEHAGILPDLVTLAKGMTSSYAPLGAVAMRRGIADHFKEHVFWGGLTYNSHPVSLATAMAVLDVYEQEGLVDNVRRLGPVMREEMDRITAAHPSVKEARNIGLFGMIDVQRDAAGSPMAPYNGSHPAMTALGRFFLEQGLFTFIRWGSFMCNPPLCITEEQLREAFAIIDAGLKITDEAMDD